MGGWFVGREKNARDANNRPRPLCLGGSQMKSALFFPRMEISFRRNVDTICTSFRACLPGCFALYLFLVVCYSNRFANTGLRPHFAQTNAGAHCLNAFGPEEVP